MVEEKIWIPEVPASRLAELGARIKPVIRYVAGDNKLQRDSGGDPYWLEPCDITKVSYTWNPKPMNRTPKLTPICDVRTYHGYGYYGMFKPSIGEVLAQIPAEHIDRVDAFEIVEQPECADDLNRESEALNAGYHVAKTRLYRIAT